MDLTRTTAGVALNDEIGGLNNEFQHLGVITSASIRTTPTASISPLANTPARKRGNSRRASTVRPTGGATWTYTTTASNGWQRRRPRHWRAHGGRSGEWREYPRRLERRRYLAQHDYGATWARLSSFPSTLTNLTFLTYAPTTHANPARTAASMRVPTRSPARVSGFRTTTATLGRSAEPSGEKCRTEMMRCSVVRCSRRALHDLGRCHRPATGPLTTACGNYPPMRPLGRPSAATGQGFFGGISADPRQAGHVVVTTLLRWWPRDEVYRSVDGGALGPLCPDTGTKTLVILRGHAHTTLDDRYRHRSFDSNRAIFNTASACSKRPISRHRHHRCGPFSTTGSRNRAAWAAQPYRRAAAGQRDWRLHWLPSRPPRPLASTWARSTPAALDPHPQRRGSRSRENDPPKQRQHALFAGRRGDLGAFPNPPEPIINGHGRVIPSTDGQRLLWARQLAAFPVASHFEAGGGVSPGGPASVETVDATDFHVSVPAYWPVAI